MKQISVLRSGVIGLIITLSFSAFSCHLVARHFFTKSVQVAIQRGVQEWVIIETVQYALDAVFTAIFQTAADETSDNVYIVSHVNPAGSSGTGFYKDPRMAFYVETERNGRVYQDIIEIPSEMIPFVRTPHGGWELAPNSKTLIKERTEVAAAQRSLITFGFNGVGKVDGILGRLTEGTLKQFQRQVGIVQTGQLDYQTREYLLTH